VPQTGAKPTTSGGGQETQGYDEATSNKKISLQRQLLTAFANFGTNLDLYQHNSTQLLTSNSSFEIKAGQPRLTPKGHL